MFRSSAGGGTSSSAGTIIGSKGFVGVASGSRTLGGAGVAVGSRTRCDLGRIELGSKMTSCPRPYMPISLSLPCPPDDEAESSAPEKNGHWNADVHLLFGRSHDRNWRGHWSRRGPGHDRHRRLKRLIEGERRGLSRRRSLRRDLSREDECSV